MTEISEMGESTSDYRLPGLICGTSGLMVLLVLHHVWIMPIWFILPIGLPIALAGGIAVSWAYHELLPWLPSRPWSSLAVIGFVAVVLTPAFVLAELRSPMFDVAAPGARH